MAAPAWADRAETYADAQKLGDFLHLHFDNLARDIAKGGGDYVTALAQLIGVPQQEQALFATILQRHYNQLFPEPWLTPQQFAKQMAGYLRFYHIAYQATR